MKNKILIALCGILSALLIFVGCDKAVETVEETTEETTVVEVIETEETEGVEEVEETEVEQIAEEVTAEVG